MNDIEKIKNEISKISVEIETNEKTIQNTSDQQEINNLNNQNKLLVEKKKITIYHLSLLEKEQNLSLREQNVIEKEQNWLKNETCSNQSITIYHFN
jgi:hypothetical protein